MKTLLLASLLLCAGPALAQGAMCDRADLDKMTNAYLAAQTAGDSLKLPLADFTSYTEQGEDAAMVSGMLGTARKIAFHRTFTDLRTCNTYTEIVITDPAAPYVVGTRLGFSGRANPIAPSRVNDLESIITTTGDRGFDAAKTLQLMQAANWAEIPAGERDDRATLMAAANAYLDHLGDKAAAVPFAPGCMRLEGAVEGACDAAPALGKAIARRFVVDEALGAVAAYALVGDQKQATVHSFRIEKGKIRSMHALIPARRA